MVRIEAAEAARYRWPSYRTRGERETQRQKTRRQLSLDESKTDGTESSNEGMEDDDKSEPSEDDEEETDDDGSGDETGDVDAESEDVTEDTGDGARGRQSRTQAGFVPSSTDVRVKPPEREHASWEAWKEYLRDYMEDTMQVLPVKETLSLREKNKRITKTRGFADSTIALVPDGLDPFQRTYICTHGWNKKLRGAGHRPQQFVRSTKCPFRFIVQACPDCHGVWRLLVRNGVWIHNHPITPDAFDAYPSSHGIKCPVNEARVDSMIAVGVKRLRVYDFLLCQGEKVTAKDVENMVSRHASKISSTDDNEMTAIEIAKFMAKNPANASTINETDAGHTGVISMTTALMRTVYARFPEFLMVDCTHKTNRYNYQLMTFMVMNEYGEGMPVQQSLIEANGDWHTDCAIEHFKRVHAGRWKLLRVIMVDKDLNEIKILQSHFPEARILICRFHVVKYLSEMYRKPVYGRISEDDHDAIDAIVDQMINAPSQDAYDSNRDDLRELCDRLGNVGFFDYMERNWHVCQDMWVIFRREDIPHFNIHTNNMLESWFGKLKDGLKSDASMTVCVREILAYERRKAKDYMYRHNKIGQNVHAGYDDEMKLVLRFTTHFVASKIFPEYAVGVAQAEQYGYEEIAAENIVRVRGHVIRNMSLVDFACDCPFAKSMQLPCRHAIAYRASRKMVGALVPLNRVDTRWACKDTELEPLTQFNYQSESAEAPRASKKQRFSPADRYRHAVRATHLIANEIADIDDPVEFNEMLQFLLGQWRNARERRRMVVTISPPTTDQDRPRSSDGDVDSTPAQSKNPAMTIQDEDMTGAELEPTQPFVDPSLCYPRDLTLTSQDEAMTDAGRESTQPEVDLSQHSLWSESVGDVRIVATAGVRFAKPTQVIETSKKEPDAHGQEPDKDGQEASDFARVKEERAARASTGRAGDASDSSIFDSSDEDEASQSVKIVLNPKARKTGRPKTNTKNRARVKKVERTQFKAAQVIRREFGIVTLGDVVTSLAEKKPDIVSAHHLLSGIAEKFSEHDDAKPKYALMMNPVLNKDAFYVLPPHLMKKCIDAFPTNSVADPIVVDGLPTSTAGVQVVSIKGFGAFSREKIVAMQEVVNLKSAIEGAIDSCKWLTDEVLPIVPAHQQAAVKATVEVIRTTWPTERLPHFAATLPFYPDLVFAIMHRALPPTWLNDALVLGLCDRFCTLYSCCRATSIVSTTSRAPNGRARTLPEQVLAQLRSYSSFAASVGKVLVPLNMGNFHWCGIVVNIDDQRVVFYDPLNQRNYLSTFDDLAQHMVAKVFRGFTCVQLNSPIQRDGFSCGIFVAWMFYRQLNPRASTVMVGSQLHRRRFELFFLVLNKCMPPGDPATLHSADAVRAQVQPQTPPPTTSERQAQSAPGGDGLEGPRLPLSQDVAL